MGGLRIKIRRERLNWCAKGHNNKVGYKVNHVQFWRKLVVQDGLRVAGEEVPVILSAVHKSVRSVTVL